MLAGVTTLVSDEQIQKLINALDSCIRAYRKILQEELKTYHLTIPQARVISVLREDGPQSFGELSKKLETSTSSITGIVDRLEKSGWVKRERDEHDRRIVWITLTEQYHEEFKHFSANQVRYLRRYIDSLKPREVTILTEKLLKLATAIENEPNS
jgi:DNA-binding MarR family transcriptional regulator